MGQVNPNPRPRNNPDVSKKDTPTGQAGGTGDKQTTSVGDLEGGVEDNSDITKDDLASMTEFRKKKHLAANITRENTLGDKFDQIT